ncbi:MAG TPA: response regulator transcription factor [Dermatophilaceae bacterium]|nr:response regulator transcription factor [Dermatophilaceae bacterium]
MAGTRVLVVDDEAPLRRLIVAYLVREQYDVREAEDGQVALEVAESFLPDLVVLDLGLPGMDGIEVCQRLRTFSDCYVVMVTARDDEVDLLVGLSVGADDYLTKPFSPRELVARIRARLRRPRLDGHPAQAIPPSRELTFGDLTVDGEAREARLGGSLVELTRTEFDLLHALAQRPGYAFSRRQLIDEVWGENWHSDDHLVDAHIVHLRRKLGDDAATGRFVRTVRGVGYRMGEGQ